MKPKKLDGIFNSLVIVQAIVRLPFRLLRTPLWMTLCSSISSFVHPDSGSTSSLPLSLTVSLGASEQQQKTVADIRLFLVDLCHQAESRYADSRRTGSEHHVCLTYFVHVVSYDSHKLSWTDREPRLTQRVDRKTAKSVYGTTYLDA